MYKSSKYSKYYKISRKQLNLFKSCQKEGIIAPDGDSDSSFSSDDSVSSYSDDNDCNSFLINNINSSFTSVDTPVPVADVAEFQPLVQPCCSNSNIVNENKESLKLQLSQWATSYSIPHNAINNLLKILKPYHLELPLDARTLLSTPRKPPSGIIDVAPGKYYHFGLEGGIKKLLSQLRTSDYSSTTSIEICINVDGLPISKSSGSQLYPILCSLMMNLNAVEIIGIYQGYEKPKDANEFLHEFVSDAINVIEKGIVLDDRTYKIQIKCFICDAPAKSFITYTKSHTAYMSCTKCCIEGQYIENRVCFPNTNNIRLRTDSSFRQKLQEEHHLGTSLIEQIPGIDMVNSFPLDYMHLVCLGVVKKLIVTLWVNGKPSTKLSFHQISSISRALIDQVQNIPKEFNRKPRSLNECKRWKATEFRQFLFYTGPLVLKGVLSHERYLNFLTLHIALTILASNKLLKHLNYAGQLLEYFVECFITLYGEEFVSHNIHNLLHVKDDVKLFGPLDQYSAFPFENFMQKIKRDLRKNNNPLQQIINRKQERDVIFSQNSQAETENFPLFQQIHFQGPLIANISISAQYKTAVFKNFQLKICEPDNCCYLNGSVILIKNFIQTENGIMILGHEYLEKKNFYDTPCESSELNIFEVNRLGPLLSWNLNNDICKMVKLTYDNKSVVFPLIHCL